MTTTVDIDLGAYKLGWSDPEDGYVFKPEKGRYLHPQWDEGDPSQRVNRAITHLEAARLQGFGDETTWCGTRSSIARQIGNAVPVGLSRAIAASVKAHLSAAV